jgi:hypothetical protein
MIVNFSVFPFGNCRMCSSDFATLAPDMLPRLLNGFSFKVKKHEQKGCCYEITLLPNSAFILNHYDNDSIEVIDTENGQTVLKGKMIEKIPEGYVITTDNDEEPPEYRFTVRELNRLETMGLGHMDAELEDAKKVGA